MTPLQSMPGLRHTAPTRGPQLVVRGLMACIAMLGFGGGMSVPTASAQTEDSSFTLTSYECSREVATDGTPLSASDCEGRTDRTFALASPDGETVELTTTLQPASEGIEQSQAFWSADPDDDVPESGIWTLKESGFRLDSVNYVSCLKVIDGSLTPATLEYNGGAGVSFEWNPAVTTGADSGEGEYLSCDWYTAPQSSTTSRPGLLTIQVANVVDPPADDLIAVGPDGDPQNVGEVSLGDVPSADFTLTNDDTGDDIPLQTDALAGEMPTTTFALEAGDYTLSADATGTSVSFTLGEGQTVLVLNAVRGSESVELETSPPTVGGDPSQIEAKRSFAFEADDWAGAYPNIITEVYQRQCVAVYGASSPNPSGTLTVNLGEARSGQSVLVLTGLDDELAGPKPIVVTVNGEVIYEGNSRFNDWDPAAAEVAWNRFNIFFPSQLLVAGENEIMVRNLAEGSEIGLPPYILLSEAFLFVDVAAVG